MSKLSFKNDTVQSSIVILKDGSCLEVRNGNKTKWLANETRNKWPSVEAWRAILPPDATPVEEKRPPAKRVKSYKDVTDPILLKILSGAKSTFHGKEFIMRHYLDIQLKKDRYGWKTHLLNQKMLEEAKSSLLSDAITPQMIDDTLATLDKEIKEMRAAHHTTWSLRYGKASKTLTSDFYLEVEDGKMYSIFWNIKEQVVMVWIPLRGLVNIRELGLSEGKILKSIWFAGTRKSIHPSMRRL
jgi:hypothetical protein